MDLEKEIEIDVPPFFICPISLEMMKDPVTVSTGISYDRDSIEKWLFSSGSNSNLNNNNNNSTCPVTKQPLLSQDLTPNHTLRRLIQGWCTINASHGIQRIPTPKLPTTKSHITKLIHKASHSHSLLPSSLQSLKSIASHSQTNRRCMESAGAAQFLASVIISGDSDLPNQEEALSILHTLHVSEPTLASLLTFSNAQLIPSLTRIMNRGSYESRAYAVLLVKSIIQVANPMHHLFNLDPELFVELVQILKDQISEQATKATLQVLIQLCELGRNRNKAVKAGGVWVLVELMMEESKERKKSEMMMVVLEMMCGCAEGRAELLSHAGGIAVVCKKILRVSSVANERAVRIVHSVARSSAESGSVLQEMTEVGVVGKMCLLLQMETGNKTKERAREILKMHAHFWRNSRNPCIPNTMLSYLA